MTISERIELIQIVRAKLHGIHVTGCDLDYHGSVTLDPDFLVAAGIYPLEFVYIWNKNNGSRLTTYVLLGERGSRCCILNGAAARLCQMGDPLIITAFEFLADPKELCARKPRVVMFDENNVPKETLEYSVVETADWYGLSVTPL